MDMWYLSCKSTSACPDNHRYPIAVAEQLFSSIFSCFELDLSDCFLFLEQVKNLKEEVEKLSKDVNTYKNSSTEYHIKLETLQHYFKQQETELHR